MELAVIKTGGKQYKVSQNTTLLVELIKDKDGKNLETGNVSFTDLLGGKKVVAKVNGLVKGPKIDTLKFKNKTRYIKRMGHRQNLTSITITEIK